MTWWDVAGLFAVAGVLWGLTLLLRRLSVRARGRRLVAQIERELTATDRAKFVAQFTSSQLPMSRWAVAGLVCSLAGVSPVGLLLTAYGLTDVRDGHNRGRGVAIAGLVLGGVGSMVWLGAYVWALAVPGVLW